MYARLSIVGGLLCFLLFVGNVAQCAAQKPPGPPDRVEDHIVIGLGLAGSELASLLARDGKSFIALEARQTYGGRAQSIKIGNYTLPKGGGWQQGGGKNHVLTSRLKSCGIRTIKQNWNRWSDYSYTGDSVSVPYGELEAAYDCASEIAIEMQARGDPDVDQDTLLKLCGWFKEDIGDHLAELSTIEFEWAEPAIATSAFASMPWVTYESPHTDEDNFIIDARGTEELVGCQLDRYVPGGRYGSLLNYKSPVANVDTDAKVVTLQNGTRIGWRFALFDTRSLAVHQYDIARNDGAGFTPEIVGLHAEAINSYHFPVYMKVFLQFPQKFWDNSQFYQIFSSNGLGGSLWQNVDLPGWLPGSRILYYTLLSTDSQRFEQLSDDQVALVVLEDLGRVFGFANVDEPETVVVSRWSNNPYFRGTYSNRPPSLTGDRFDAIFKPFGVDNSVVFTGEAYCDRMNGYLHAAVLAAQTTYDEWKIRRGESPLLRTNPRDNLCFVANPVSGPEGNLASSKRNASPVNSNGQRRRMNRFDHGQSDRRSNVEHWREVERRASRARGTLGFTGNNNNKQ